MKKQKRVRVTLSLAAETVRWLDSHRKAGDSRSRVTEAVLLEELRRREQLELDAEIRACYAKPPTADELSLSRGLGRVARRLVIDEPQNSTRRAK